MNMSNLAELESLNDVPFQIRTNKIVFFTSQSSMSHHARQESMTNQAAVKRLKVERPARSIAQNLRGFAPSS